MNNIVLSIANASHTLDKQVSRIESAFKRASETATTLLELSSIDVICIDDPSQVIPEIGVSGFTPNRHLVYLYVDSNVALDEKDIYATLIHEFAHAKRYDGQGFGSTLFDSIIFEGLGVALEEETSGDNGTFLSNYLKNQDNKALLGQIASHFGDHEFNRFHWFIEESDDLLRWTGYRVGYYIVTEYMKKTNKKASELLMEDFETFREFVSVQS